MCLDKRAHIKFHIFLLTPEVAYSVAGLYALLIHVPVPLAGVRAGFWRRNKTKMNAVAGLFFSQNHSAHERNMIKSPSSSLKYQFVRLFDLFFVLYFFFQDPAFNLPLCPACCTQVPADANRAQSISRLGTGATGRMAANKK